MKYLVLLLILAFSSSLMAEDKIDQLIKDLGANDPNVRTSAGYRLQKIGFPARPLLTEALKSPDTEIRLQAAKLLDRLTLEEAWLPRRVTLKEKAITSEILSKLAEQSGNRLYIGNPYGAIKDIEIEVDYSDIPYWQAIDDVCRKTQNKIRPHYDAQFPGMVVSEGDPGDYTTAYSGPVRGLITNARRIFSEDLNYENINSELVNKFTIGFQFSWENRFKLIAYAKNPKFVEGVTDNELPLTAVNSSNSEQVVTDGTRQISASIDLNPIPLSAKLIKTLAVDWEVIGLSAPSVLEISLEPDRVSSQDDLAAQVKSIDFDGTKYTITVLIRRDLAIPDTSDILLHECEIEVIDDQGKLFDTNDSFSLVEQGVQAKVTFQADNNKPKLVKLHYYRHRTRRDVRLIFKDVPLPTARPE